MMCPGFYIKKKLKNLFLVLGLWDMDLLHTSTPCESSDSSK